MQAEHHEPFPPDAQRAMPQGTQRSNVTELEHRGQVSSIRGAVLRPEEEEGADEEDNEEEDEDEEEDEV